MTAGRFIDQRSLDDPEVWEDVQFLLDLGRPNEEIARRCNVGLYALQKRVGMRRHATDRREFA